MTQIGEIHESEMSFSSALNHTQSPFLPLWVGGIALATMPVLAFALQFWFSSRDNTLPLLFQHYTVSYVDWIFVPFNFFVVYAVNWRRGGLLFLTMIFSVVFNVIAHAYWQHALIENPGHMFGRDKLVLQAGWVHIAYATIQMCLLLAFLLVRQPNSQYAALLTRLCVVYFLCAGISGYLMNKGFMVTDVIMVSLGLILTLVYPRFAYGASADSVRVM